MVKKKRVMLKTGISLLAIAFAILRVLHPDETSMWLDTNLLLLVAIPFLAFLVPWHRLKAFKAAGIGV